MNTDELAGYHTGVKLGIKFAVEMTFGYLQSDDPVVKHIIENMIHEFYADPPGGN